MWERIDLELPPEIASSTTSVWRYPEIMLVGVMRKTFLSPPILWGQTLKAGLRNLRQAPAFLDQFQQLISAPTVYAEAELTATRNQALLKYLGFVELPDAYERKLYLRSI